MGVLTRRAALSMTGALATAAVPVAAQAAEDPRIAELFREADALERDTAIMNATPHTQEEWDAFSENRDERFLSQVGALPESPPYAKIRARAVQLLYGDTSELFAGEEATTDVRLAAQIVRSLLPKGT